MPDAVGQRSQHEVLSPLARTFDAHTLQGEALWEAGQSAEAFIEHAAAVSAGNRLLTEMASRLVMAAESALRARKHPEAMALFTQAERLHPQGRIAQRWQQVMDAWRGAGNGDPRHFLALSDPWLDGSPMDSERMLLIARLLHQLELKGRALDFELKGLRLALNQPGQAWDGASARIAEIERDLAARTANNRGLPNVVLYGMECSGGSAVHPVLEEILTAHFHYDSFWNPTFSPWFPRLAAGPTPILHWTHHPVGWFKDFITRPDYRFLCLYREPRDTAVSNMKINIEQYRADFPGKSDRDLLAHVVSGLPGPLTRACEWLAIDDPRFFKFSFEAMKRDTPALLRAIFDFLQIPVDPALLEEVIARHHFEKVAKRKPGESGQIIGRGYHMYRKGISGDWKNHFDAEMESAFWKDCARFMEMLGYSRNGDAPPPAGWNQWGDKPFAAFPALIDSDYLGHRIHLHGGRFCATARELGDVDLRADALQGRWGVFTAASLEAVREEVRAHLPLSTRFADALDEARRGHAECAASCASDVDGEAISLLHHLCIEQTRRGMKAFSVGAYVSKASLAILDHVRAEKGMLFLTEDFREGPEAFPKPTVYQRTVFRDIIRRAECEAHATILGDMTPLVKDQSADLIFLNGDMASAKLCDDILFWYPKLKYGGALCGRAPCPTASESTESAGAALDVLRDLFPDAQISGGLWRIRKGAVPRPRLQALMDTRALMAEGHAALQAGKPAVALNAFKRLIKIAPDLAGAHTGLAQACLALGRLSEALPPLRRAAELLPDDPNIREALQSLEAPPNVEVSHSAAGAR